MENTISRPATGDDMTGVYGMNAEPYVGMPIYLDDSFFQFVSEDIELDCDTEGNMKPGGGMMPPTGGMMPPMGGTGATGGNTGGMMPDMSRPLNDCARGCPLAMAYVPWQGWEGTYEPEKGFMVGTIFPCLDLPFMGGAGK